MYELLSSTNSAVLDIGTMGVGSLSGWNLSTSSYMEEEFSFMFGEIRTLEYEF